MGADPDKVKPVNSMEGNTSGREDNESPLENIILAPGSRSFDKLEPNIQSARLSADNHIGNLGVIVKKGLDNAIAQGNKDDIALFKEAHHALSVSKVTFTDMVVEQPTIVVINGKEVQVDVSIPASAGVYVSGNTYMNINRDVEMVYLNGLPSEQTLGGGASYQAIRSGDEGIFDLISHEFGHMIRSRAFGNDGKQLDSDTQEIKADEFMNRLRELQ